MLIHSLTDVQNGSIIFCFIYLFIFYKQHFQSSFRKIKFRYSFLVFHFSLMVSKSGVIL